MISTIIKPFRSSHRDVPVHCTGHDKWSFASLHQSEDLLHSVSAVALFRYGTTMCCSAKPIGLHPWDIYSVADPGSRYIFDPWIRDPEKVFSGSRIANPYFWELSDNFFGSIFFLYQLKNKIIYNFVFVATKKVGQQIFSPFSFVAVVESGIQGQRDYILYVNPN
jgi:hypothetical protein